MQQDDETTPSPPGSPARSFRSRAVAIGLAAGLVLAGFGIASAQESPSTTAPEEEAPASGESRPARPFEKHMRHKVFFGPMGGMGRGIHGEFTVPDGEDGYRTIASQVGAVTSVSQSSIRVKSEDGFERTYKVDENTLVNAGRDGISDVKDGDEVRITAVVEDGDARAVQVFDTTNVRRLGQQWWPHPRREKAAD